MRPPAGRWQTATAGQKEGKRKKEETADVDDSEILTDVVTPDHRVREHAHRAGATLAVVQLRSALRRAMPGCRLQVTHGARFWPQSQETSSRSRAVLSMSWWLSTPFRGTCISKPKTPRRERQRAAPRSSLAGARVEGRLRRGGKPLKDKSGASALTAMPPGAAFEFGAHERDNVPVVLAEAIRHGSVRPTHREAGDVADGQGASGNAAATPASSISVASG